MGLGFRAAAGSLAEFIKRAKAIGESEIAVSPYQQAIGKKAHSPVTGMVRVYQLGVLYSARGTWGRRVTFFEVGMEPTLSERGFEDSSLYQSARLICFITAYARVQSLAAAHPELVFALWTNEGLVGEDELRELLEEAASNHLRPFVTAVGEADKS